MHCPICPKKETKVVDSRVSGDGTGVRRRRECEKCKFRFSTVEQIELRDLMVVKSDGRREMYSREKLVRGLKRSLEKRPYTDEKFDKLVQKIERDIQKKRKTQLTSAQVGEIVMKQLKSFDKIAYIRFASVYRSFEDVNTFDEELKKLLTSGAKHPSTKKIQKKS